jgi:gamma-glutamyltranspeptidase/glutathione hydrolase
MLQAIATQGDAAFYAGPVPAAIEAASQAGGGVLTAADFSAYRVQETKPLTCRYRGFAIVSTPPPSSGGTTLCEILGVLQKFDLHALGFHGAAAVHLMAEAMRHAFLDRNTYLGDPDFVDNPTDWLLSDAHLSAIRAAIGPRATPSASLAIGAAPHERPETTSFAVVDAAGNAVSVTYTLNGGFGAGVMAPGTGFLLNDEMDDFSIAPNTPNLYGLVQGARNAIAPGKRPLSSMTPTIVLRGQQLAYVLGSPGGSRIITIVADVLLNLIDYDMAPQEAVDAPRLHLQYLPDKLFAEPFALSPDTAALLRTEGYEVVEQTPWGAAELIAVEPASRADAPASSRNDATPEHAVSARLLGASDPRRPAGAAVGG